MLSNDPIGWGNNYVLNKHINYWAASEICDLWIGWGVKGKLMNRDNEILRKIQKTINKTPKIIGLTKDGHPKHPLYINKKSCLYPLPLRKN